MKNGGKIETDLKNIKCGGGGNYNRLFFFCLKCKIKHILIKKTYINSILLKKK